MQHANTKEYDQNEARAYELTVRKAAKNQEGNTQKRDVDQEFKINGKVKRGEWGYYSRRRYRWNPRNNGGFNGGAGGLEPPLPIPEPWSLHEFLGKVLSYRWG